MFVMLIGLVFCFAFFIGATVPAMAVTLDDSGMPSLPNIHRNIWRLTMRVFLAMTFLCSMLLSSVYGATYYVAKNNPGGCSDDWPGTEAQP